MQTPRFLALWGTAGVRQCARSSQEHSSQVLGLATCNIPPKELLSMAYHAVIDPRPADYRDARLCAAYLAPDLMKAMGAATDNVIRITTHRERTVLARVAGPFADGAA